MKYQGIVIQWIGFIVLCWIFQAPAFGQEERKIHFTMVYADTLEMDLFLPKASSKPAPLLIYVHGGGFSGGARDEPNHLGFCERMAEAGWATATISYHLTMKGKSFGCDQPAQNKIATIRTAAENIHRAVAYLIRRSDQYQINARQVVIAGSSAGAEAVLHAAYWQETREQFLPEQFQYAGVISLAGALLDINWITEETAIPTALFHGACDSLVPYGTAAHHYCAIDRPGFMMLFGSASIAQRMRSLGKPYFLLTDCGGGHEWASLPIEKNHDHQMLRFLKEYVLNARQYQIELTEHIGELTCDMEFCD